MTNFTKTIEIDSETREILGFVHVTSGQLLLADPGTIDREWEDAKYHDIRRFRHKQTGVVLQYEKDFRNFAWPIPSEGGRTMNDLLGDGVYEKLENKRVRGVSYYASATATLSSDGGGQLVEMRHGHHYPAAVSVDVPIRNDTLPVYIERREDGSPKRLVIDLPSSRDQPDDEKDPEAWEAFNAHLERMHAISMEMVGEIVESSRNGGDQAVTPKG
jgi:hypothetical protein